MKDKKYVLGGALVLVIIAIFVGLFLKGSGTGSDDAIETQEVSTDKPVNIALDFYELWLDAVQSTSTDPQQLGLAQNPILSQALRTRLSEISGDEETDPVLCQNPTPEKINGKTLYVMADKAQVLVFSKHQDMAGQAIVTLLPLNDGWYIDDILCSRGEFDVPREFTFVYEGNLLKSVPPPLNPDYWHLVYTQDGTPGYAAQLFFDAESQCTDLSGNQYQCDPSQLPETQKVMLKGNMTELGVEVKWLDYIE